jgi:hypothetical protein
MEVTNTLAYYNTETFTVVKSFMVQAQGERKWKKILLVKNIENILLHCACLVKYEHTYSGSNKKYICCDRMKFKSNSGVKSH